MARTKINVCNIGLEDMQAVTTENLDATNGMYFECANKDSVFLVITNTDSTNGITVKIKGAGNHSDKSFTVAKSSHVVIGNLESAKYKQTGEVINVDITVAQGATASGKIFGIQDLV